MAEQDRLDQVLRQRAAIDRDERPGAARAAAVDGACDHFLADAGLAFDQHGDGGGGRLLGGAQHAAHGGRAGDDVGEAERAVLFALQALQFAGQPAGGKRVAQRNLQALGVGRLDHEIGGARAHGGNHIVDAAMGGLHDDRQVEARRAHARQHAEPVEIGHHQVEHHAIEARAIGAGEQMGGLVAALGQQGPVAETLHHGFEQATLDRIVIDDQHDFGHGTPQHCTELVQCRRFRLMGC